jgi:hypothetical protein
MMQFGADAVENNIEFTFSLLHWTSAMSTQALPGYYFFMRHPPALQEAHHENYHMEVQVM